MTQKDHFNALAAAVVAAYQKESAAPESRQPRKTQPPNTLRHAARLLVQHRRAMRSEHRRGLKKSLTGSIITEL